MIFNLHTENGTPMRSLMNQRALAEAHGPMVGMIHSILPNMTHRTLFFFTDGWVHTATGLAIGWEGQLPTKGLRKLVDEMGMKPNHVAMCDYFGTEDDVAVELKAGREVHYLFATISKALGIRAMGKVVENLWEDARHVIEVAAL